MAAKGELYRVVFSDDHEEEAYGDGSIDAAKRAARRYKAKAKKVRVLSARRAR
jgi:hypothetical protein